MVHRNKEVYGDDVEAFRPDRWLKEDNGDMRKHDPRDSVTIWVS